MCGRFTLQYSKEMLANVFEITRLEDIRMKLIIFIILLLLVSPVYADEAFGPDKVSHFCTSAVWGGLAETALYHNVDSMGPFVRTLTATAIGTIPGLGVEIGDEFTKGNHFNWSDLLADGIGAFTGAITGELINGKFWISASGNQIKLGGKW